MMTISAVRRSSLGLLAAALLALAPAVAHTEAQVPTPVQEINDENVQEELSKQLTERRRAMLEEAHAALNETNVAVQALDGGKTRDALDALARATGKLELLVAREPELALAPIRVGYSTHDLYATPEAIRSARDQAETLLEDGRVQEARSLLSGLASEIVVSVTSLPLATYPEAIKAISPLIDAGRIEEAKAALGAALGTLVITNQVVSLPVLRARAALDEAESLVGADDPSAEAKEEVSALVEAAREQLEMAELLGYGNKNDYKQFRDEIAELEGRVRDDKETNSIFAKLRKSLDGLEMSFLQ